MWLIPWLWGIVVGTVVIAGLLVFWNVRAHRRRNVLVDDGAADRRFHSGLDQGLIAGAVLALTTGYSLGLQTLGVSRFALSISDLLWLLLGGVLLVISFLAGLLFQSSKAVRFPSSVILLDCSFGMLPCRGKNLVRSPVILGGPGTCLYPAFPRCLCTSRFYWAESLDDGYQL